MRIQTTAAAVLLSLLLPNSSASAQGRHVVDPAMYQAIADQAARDQQNREALLGVMHRSDVRDLADRLGLSLTGAEGAVATLSSAELTRLAGPLADTELPGGSNTIVISTTTLLLGIIILILLLK